MPDKQRISASVDADLVDAARRSVAAGEADTISSWVNQALRRQVDHQRRLRAMDEFLAAYEAEHGEITEQEMQDAARRARAGAIVVRSGRGAA